MMEFDDIIVKESPGLCRCCLSEGCYKDLGSEYTWMNDTEVYADMLLECFDISITQHNEGPNGPNRLICEVCITRLRDACNFKKQVLDSEKKFVDMIGRGEFRPKVVIYQAQLKSEDSGAQGQPIDEADVEYLEDNIEFGDDDLVKDESTEPSVSEITVSTLPVKGKRGRPRKQALVEKTEKRAKTNEDKPKTSKPTSKGELRGGQKPTEKQVSTVSDVDYNISISASTSKRDLTPKEKRNIMRNNVVHVLTKSNVMPFRWLKSSYRCFYCYEIFQDASDLKNHQHSHSGDAIKQQAMKNYWEPVVYVDISNIACNLCPDKIEDLFNLIDHLIAVHNVDYNKDVGICIVAFKLDNYNISCLACGASFYSFGPLLHHTNKDHKGTSAILCDVCGQHFKDANLLRLHMKTVHENAALLCTECGEKFDSRSKLKTHQKNEHDIDKQYKCSVCSETFQSHYKRSRHMAAEHKNRPENKCPHCPKTFVFRSMMMTHLRDSHLKVRNHVCGVCGWKAFNSNRLKTHMYKHSGEKNFKCDACDKAFSTKKIMKAHLARVHKSPNPIMPYDNSYIGQ